MFRGKKDKDQVPKEEVFSYDPDHGTVVRLADEARVMALEARGWATIEKELASTFMTGGAVILQRLGYSYGVAMGRLAKRQELDTERTFEVMQAMARESGWGLLTLSSGDLSAGEARVTVRECFFCLHAKESAEPVCHVLVGLTGGITDEIMGTSHRVTETKCIAKGDALCEILIESLG